MSIVPRKIALTKDTLLEVQLPAAGSGIERRGTANTIRFHESVNMEDLEFVMAGPVVRDISTSFDDFWNSPVAYPVELLDPDSVTDENLQELREKLAKANAEAKNGWYAKGLRSSDPMQRLLHGDRPVQWSGEYTFVSDDPLKATGTLEDADASNVGKLLSPSMGVDTFTRDPSAWNRSIRESPAMRAPQSCYCPCRSPHCGRLDDQMCD